MGWIYDNFYVYSSSSHTHREVSVLVGELSGESDQFRFLYTLGIWSWKIRNEDWGGWTLENMGWIYDNFYVYSSGLF